MWLSNLLNVDMLCENCSKKKFKKSSKFGELRLHIKKKLQMSKFRVRRFHFSPSLSFSHAKKVCLYFYIFLKVDKFAKHCRLPQKITSYHFRATSVRIRSPAASII